MITSMITSRYWLDCYGYPVPEDASVLSLSSGDTNVGTRAVSADNEDIVLTGVGVGSTAWTATYFFEYYEVIEDYGCTGSGDYRDMGDDMTTLSITITKADDSALPSPFRIGVNGGGHDRTQHLKATVSPDNVALTSVNIDVSTKLTGSITQRSGRVVSFDVVGKDAASKSASASDSTITARVGSVDITTKYVSVVVPSEFAAPHDTTGTYQAKNVVLDANTSPPVIGLAPDEVRLDTIYARFLTVTVKDQFGALIGDIYNQATVTETIGSLTININQPPSADSTYLDPVGQEQLGRTVTRGSPDANAWHLQPLIPMMDSTFTQNIAVQVDGFQLDPAIVSRHVSAVTPNTIDIIWP